MKPHPCSGVEGYDKADGATRAAMRRAFAAGAASLRGDVERLERELLDMVAVVQASLAEAEAARGARAHAEHLLVELAGLRDSGELEALSSVMDALRSLAEAPCRH